MAAISVMRSPVFSGSVRQGTGKNLGSVVLTQTNTVGFADAAVAKTLFTLPATSQILEIYVDVTTAFNSSGTDLLDIGLSGTGDAYFSAVSIASTGRIIGSSDAGGSGTFTGWASIGATDVAVTALYSQSVADASTGAARITVVYALPSAEWN